MPLSALSGSRLSWGERRGTRGIFVFGGAFSVRRAGRAFFFSFFLAWCCFFSYLCPWFSALSRGCFSVSLGLFRGVGFRLLCRVWMVRLVRSACAARALLSFLGAGRRRVSAFRFVVVRSAWVFVDGGLVGGLLVRIPGRCVGAFGRDPRSWRSAFSVFLIFFNSGQVWAAWMPRVLKGKKIGFF